MSDLKLDFDSDHKQINLDPVNSPSSLNIKQDDSNAMLGVELLVNEKKSSKADLNVTTEINAGYSSGEENVKKSVKEDLNFFGDDKPSTPPPVDFSNDQSLFLVQVLYLFLQL